MFLDAGWPKGPRRQSLAPLGCASGILGVTREHARERSVTEEQRSQPSLFVKTLRRRHSSATPSVARPPQPAAEMFRSRRLGPAQKFLVAGLIPFFRPALRRFRRQRLDGLAPGSLGGGGRHDGLCSAMNAGLMESKSRRSHPRRNRNQGGRTPNVLDHPQVGDAPRAAGRGPRAAGRDSLGIWIERRCEAPKVAARPGFPGRSWSGRSVAW